MTNDWLCNEGVVIDAYHLGWWCKCELGHAHKEFNLKTDIIVIVITSSLFRIVLKRCSLTTF